jgi:hypothetical protein
MNILTPKKYLPSSDSSSFFQVQTPAFLHAYTRYLFSSGYAFRGQRRDVASDGSTELSGLAFFPL